MMEAPQSLENVGRTKALPSPPIHGGAGKGATEAWARLGADTTEELPSPPSHGGAGKGRLGAATTEALPSPPSHGGARKGSTGARAEWPSEEAGLPGRGCEESPGRGYHTPLARLFASTTRRIVVLEAKEER